MPTTETRRINMKLKALIKFLQAQGMSITAIARSSLDNWLIGQRDLSSINKTRLIRWIKSFTAEYLNLLQECDDLVE